jgi:hypothetical protein
MLPMHLVQRLYRDVLLPEEINRRVVTAAVPAMRTLPGFLGYTLVDFRGGRLGSYSMFAGKAGAERMAMDVPGLTRGTLRDLIQLPPEVRAGEVVLHRRVAGRAETMVVRHHGGCTDAPELARRIDTLILPRLAALAGFHGYTLVDEGAGRVTSLSLFGTRAELEAAEAVAAPLEALHLAELLPGAAETMVGRVLSDNRAQG